MGDVLSVDVVIASVLRVRSAPVRPVVDRCAVFRSTTREAVDVLGSILTLFVPVERSLVASHLMRSPLVFPPTSMTFIRDVRVSVLLGVVLEVLADEELDVIFIFCRVLVWGSILRVTLAEVVLRVVELGKIDWVDFLDDVFAALLGMIVLEVRLELFAGLILLLTLAGVVLRVVALGKVDRVDLLDDAFAALPGMIVLEVRLELLAEEVDTVRVFGAADWLLVAVLATSTVRFTGRE